MIIRHDWRVEFSTLSHHSEKFGKQRFGGTGDVVFFISHVII